MFRAVRNSGQCMNQWNQDNEACNADYKNKNNELKDPKTKNCWVSDKFCGISYTNDMLQHKSCAYEWKRGAIIDIKT